MKNGGLMCILRLLATLMNNLRHSRDPSRSKSAGNSLGSSTIHLGNSTKNCPEEKSHANVMRHFQNRGMFE